MTFDQYLAAYVLGDLRSDDLHEVATQALTEGYDGVALATLAGSTLEGSSVGELEDLFTKSLDEAGTTLPDRRAAAAVLKRYYAAGVASCAIDARAGAGAIVGLATELADICPSKKFAGDGIGVARLLGLYYSHDDVPNEDESSHQKIDEEIRRECASIASEPAV